MTDHEAKKAIAYHEAGHCVGALSGNVRDILSWIRKENQNWKGMTTIPLNVDDVTKFNQTISGPVAERLTLGFFSEHAENELTNAHESFCAVTKSALTLETSFELTERVLRHYWPLVEHIASDLMQHLSLDQTYFERYDQREMRNWQQHTHRS